MSIVNEIFGKEPVERFQMATFLALPSVALAMHCFLAHRPLFNTSLVTAATVSMPLIESYIDCTTDSSYEGNGIAVLSIGSAVALTVWSASKAVVESGLVNRAGYATNLLANVAWIGFCVYGSMEK